MAIAFVLYHAYYKIPNKAKQNEIGQASPIYVGKRDSKEAISNLNDVANETLLPNVSHDEANHSTTSSDKKIRVSKKKDLVRLSSSLSTQTGEIIGSLNQDRDKRKNSIISENSKESHKSSSEKPDETKTYMSKSTMSSKAKISSADKKSSTANKKTKNLKKSDNSETTD